MYIGNPVYQVAFLTDTFSGDASTTAFTMSVAPANTSSVLVAISGVVQDPSTYSVNGKTLTFTAAPPSATGNISARYLGIPASNVTTTAYRTVTEFTATASQTTFTPPSYTVGFISVYRNGVRLGSADYTASNGTTVVLTNAATAGDLVTTESFLVSSVLNAIPNTAGSISSNNIPSGITLNSPVIIGSVPQITVYTSSSGTYTVPTNARYLYIKMVGGGGGGAGGGTSPGNGGNGGTTTFGSSLLTCTGGTGGVPGNNLNTASGGTATINSPATGLAISGAQGGNYVAGNYALGGAGGSSPFGGSGALSQGGQNGFAAASNSGSGGSGGSYNSTGTNQAGTGGGSGGYIEAYITSPSSTYSYVVGSGGTAGTAGTSGQTGGAGGSGVIIVTAFF